jgi:hypothetical protein
LARGVEDSLLQTINVLNDTIENGEPVVSKAAQNSVQQVARAAAHHLPAQVLTGMAVVEQLGQGPQVTGVGCDDVGCSSKDVHLAGNGNSGLLVEPGEMEHQEKVVFKLIKLGKLHYAEAVVQGELVKRKPFPLFGGAYRRHASPRACFRPL